MPDRDIQLTGAADTVHGATLSIHQDHDGVRIDAGIREYMLDRAAAVMLRDAIDTALYEAQIWEADNSDGDYCGCCDQAPEGLHDVCCIEQHPGARGE